MLLFEGYSKKDPFCIWQICWIVVSVFWNIGAEIIPETPLSFPVTLLVLSILCNTITATHISWKPYISQLQQLNYRTKIINPTVLFSFSLWNYLSKRTSEYSLSKKKKKGKYSSYQRQQARFFNNISIRQENVLYITISQNKKLACYLSHTSEQHLIFEKSIIIHLGIQVHMLHMIQMFLFLLWYHTVLQAKEGAYIKERVV